MLHRRSGYVLNTAVLVALLSLDVAAQDRVILFESSRVDPVSRRNTVPGEIREIDVAQGGRILAIRRTVPLPAHFSRTPVALADGQRIMWLMPDTPLFAATVLAQYDVRTGRASIVDAGSFGFDAMLVADPNTVRVFVVQRRSIVVVDAQFHRREIPVSLEFGAERAALAAGRLFVVPRSGGPGTADQVLVVNIESLSLERTIPNGLRVITVRRDGQRFYRGFAGPTANGVELVSVSTGAVLARWLGFVESGLFAVDEARGVVLVDEVSQFPPSTTVRMRVLDADTLQPVGELAPGQYALRRRFKISETPLERAILLLSTAIGIRDICESPRVDVFDGASYAQVQRVELDEGHCPVIIPLPRP